MGFPILGIASFYDCDALTSVTIPSSVDTIYGSIFMSCNNITTVYYNAPNSYIFTNTVHTDHFIAVIELTR
jgi:hypothetical protein